MGSSDFICTVYGFVAVTGAFLSIFVMQRTERDKINMVDPIFLQWVRRFGFVSTSFALCYSVISKDWSPSVPVLLLVSAGVANLAINAIALQNRSGSSPGKLQMVTPHHRRVRNVKTSV